MIVHEILNRLAGSFFTYSGLLVTYQYHDKFKSFSTHTNVYTGFSPELTPFWSLITQLILTQILTKYEKTKLSMRTFLNGSLPGRWNGRASDNNNVPLKWPTRLCDFTHCDFFYRSMWNERSISPVFIQP